MNSVLIAFFKSLVDINSKVRTDIDIIRMYLKIFEPSTTLCCEITMLNYENETILLGFGALIREYQALVNRMQRVKSDPLAQAKIEKKIKDDKLEIEKDLRVIGQNVLYIKNALMNSRVRCEGIE